MTIFFNKKFYSLEAIKKAIKAYDELAVFKLKEKKNNIKVDVSRIEKSVKALIKDEFCNYVLAETKRFK
ncbi:MAG: HxsD-like protein [Candidatus Nealsonbacteria bacterium]